MSRERPPVLLPDEPAVSRRRFVQGLATAGILGALPFPFRRALAAATAGVPLLGGRDFALEIGPVPVNMTGRSRTAIGINGQVPAPILRWREGDMVTLAVTNRLPEPSSIHWHGIRTPSPMDGVPGLSFTGIAPGETFTYRFPVHQSGTYWYHSHSGFQEQSGLYGSIVIEAARWLCAKVRPRLRRAGGNLQRGMGALKRTPATSAQIAKARWETGLRAIVTEAKRQLLSDLRAANAEIDTAPALAALTDACGGKVRQLQEGSTL
jgi:hypothetical protein